MKQNNLYKNINLYIIFGITLNVVMGVSIIAPTLPTIANYFKIPYSSVIWVITIFTLPGIILTPILGILSDHIGRKILIVPSLIIFGLAGFLILFINNFKVLLILRFIQGLGISALGALNVTIIGDIFHGKDRTLVFGYNAGVLSVGTALYPAIGGFLSSFKWNYPFAVSIFAIFVAILVILFLDYDEPKNEHTISDYLKNILILLKKPVIYNLILLTLTFFIILYGPIITYYPYLIAKRFTAHPSKIGIFMSLMSFSTALASTQIKKISRHFDEAKMILIGFSIVSIAFIILALSYNYFLLIFSIVLCGSSNAITNPSVLSLLSANAPSQYRGAIMSLNGMILRIGQTIGPVFMGLFTGYFSLTGSFIFIAILTFLVVSSIYIKIRYLI